jgi:hypothetical protein
VVEAMNRKEKSWMTLLMDIWRHTPLCIVLAALKGVRGARRSRSIKSAPSTALAPETEVSAQAK